MDIVALFTLSVIWFAGSAFPASDSTTDPSLRLAACWTDWFDRDNPSGKGDYETLQDLRNKYPGSICKEPSGVEATTLTGIPASNTGNVFQYYDATVGFVCVNGEQKKLPCLDYRVRFLCPPFFCHVCWTEWFDRDDPGGKGDYETLQDLRAENPGKICQYPIAIEATTLTGIPASQTGDPFLTFDVVTGLVCVNPPFKRRCHDYTVRFGCHCESPVYLDYSNM